MNDTALLARNRLDIGIQTHVKLKRGWVLTEIKKHKLYEGKADSFNEYLSQEDVRTDAKICMDLYNFYIVEHKLHSEDIEDIHYLRLLEAMKAITKQPDNLWEWLDNCRILSWKDLINAVRETRGLAEMPKVKSSAKEVPPPPGSHCILHPERPAEAAHWPITKAMGGKFTIPLCRECHTEYHTKGDVTFYNNYKGKIGKWLETL